MKGGGGAGVAVVGAGPAGLAAAWHLAAAGVRVEVFESRDRVGGRMRSVELDGAIVDVGVQLLSASFSSLFRLVSAVGGSDLLVPVPGRDALQRSGRAHVIAYGSVASMATSSALPASLKLRLATRYLPFLATKCRSLDVNDPAGSGALEWDDISIEAWGEAELGRDFVELMAYPFLASYYGLQPETTSAALYHAFAKVGLDVRLYAVRGGTGALAQCIAHGIEMRGGVVHCNARVLSVNADGATAEIRTAEGVRRFDGVVLAVPAAEAAHLASLAADARAWLGAVSVHPALTLALVTRRPYRTGWFALSVPRTESPGEQLVAVCVEPEKSRDRAPDGTSLLVAVPAPAATPRLMASDPAEVASELVSAVNTVLPGSADAIVSAKLFRHPEGFTQFPPGYIRHLLRFDPAWLPARLALAGDYRVAPTVEGAVVSGERAADRLLAAIGPPPRW